MLIRTYVKPGQGWDGTRAGMVVEEIMLNSDRPIRAGFRSIGYPVLAWVGREARSVRGRSKEEVSLFTAQELVDFEVRSCDRQY